jgi:hypothetical protein
MLLLDSSIRRNLSPSSSRSCWLAFDNTLVRKYVLDKVMPQNSRWVLQHPHKSSNLHLVIIYCWPDFAAG